MRKMHGAEAMTHEQRTQLIEHFMYRLKLEDRQTLMATLPAAYNAYFGEKILTVTTRNGTEVFPETTAFVDGQFKKKLLTYAEESELNT